MFALLLRIPQKMKINFNFISNSILSEWSHFIIEFETCHKVSWNLFHKIYLEKILFLTTSILYISAPLNPYTELWTFMIFLLLYHLHVQFKPNYLNYLYFSIQNFYLIFWSFDKLQKVKFLIHYFFLKYPAY